MNSCGGAGVTRTVSTGLLAIVAFAGEPALPEKCRHRSQCECSWLRSPSPCAEYTAAQAISAQAVSSTISRLRGRAVLKKLTIHLTEWVA